LSLIKSIDELGHPATRFGPALMVGEHVDKRRLAHVRAATAHIRAEWGRALLHLERHRKIYSVLNSHAIEQTKLNAKHGIGLASQKLRLPHNF
jgi:hypothetical protein